MRCQICHRLKDLLLAIAVLEGDAVEGATIILGLPDSGYNSSDIDGRDGALLCLLALEHLLKSFAIHRLAWAKAWR
jgi:hypothetical protein